MRRSLLRPPRTIRSALFAIIAIALAPLLVLGGAEIVNEYGHARDSEIRSSAELARAVGSGFEAFVQSLVRTEHAVAVSVAKHPDSSEQTEIELAAVQADFPAVRDMSWLDARGQVLATTEARLEGRSFFAREYVQDIVLRGAEWRVSPLVRSVVDERPTFIVARAYRPGGVLVGIMAAAVDAERLTATVAQRSGGGATSVFDSEGTLVVAQSSEQIPLDWETRRRAAEHPWVRSALAGHEAGGIARSPFSGALRVGANVPIPSIGWVAHASRPLEDAIAPVRRSAALHAAVLAVLALTALGAALALARSIAGSLRELEQHAADLAANGCGPLRVRGPVEVRRVGRALDSMAASLAERRAELEGVNAELERARRTAEAAAEAAGSHGAELEAVLAAIPMALLIFGPDGKVVRANERAGEMMSVGPEDVGRALDDLRPRLRLFTAEGRALALEEQPLGRALRGEVVRGDILRAEREGVAVWAAASAAPIRGADGAVRGAVVTVVDVTHLRELQVERETLMQTVSHDLRTPLHVIVGHAEILRRRCDEEARKRSEAILASAGRMTRLIGDLVDAARLEAGHVSLQLEPTDLAAFLAGWTERMAGALPVERVRTEIVEPVPAILADPARLDQILVNLVSNALKYSLAGSEVRVTLSSSEEALRLSVADRGPGIDPEELPRLFERYYRARSGAQAEGLGLGLFITRKLVEAHGWHIEVESHPGTGSVFTVVIPGNGGRAARPSAAA